MAVEVLAPALFRFVAQEIQGFQYRHLFTAGTGDELIDENPLPARQFLDAVVQGFGVERLSPPALHRTTASRRGGSPTRRFSLSEHRYVSGQ
jgi:hypothetical protein